MQESDFFLYFKQGQEENKKKINNALIKDLDLYIKYIDLLGQDSEPFRIRGLYKEHLKRYKEALNDYNKAIAIQPSKAVSYLNRGVLLGKMNQTKAAQEDLTKAIYLDPNSGKAQLNRGILFMKMGKLNDALSDFEQSIKFDEKNAYLKYFLKGIINTEMEMDEKAMEDYNKAITLNPKFSPAYNKRGELYWKNYQISSALSDFSMAIQLDPSSEIQYFNRGKINFYMKNFELALQDFDRGLELNQNNYDAYYQRGTRKSFIQALVFQAQKKFVYALQDLNKAVSMDKSNQLFLLKRGDLLIEMNQYLDGVADYIRSGEMDSKNIQPFLYRMQKIKTKLSNQDHYDKQLQILNTAIQKQPKDQSNYLKIGKIYQNLGKCNEAILNYNKAISLNQNNSEAFLQRGCCFAKLKDFSQAFENFDQALNINPSCGEAFIQKAIALAYMKNSVQAQQYCEKALKLQPNNLFLQYQISTVYQILDQIQDAKIYLIKARNELKANTPQNLRKKFNLEIEQFLNLQVDIELQYYQSQEINQQSQQSSNKSIQFQNSNRKQKSYNLQQDDKVQNISNVETEPDQIVSIQNQKYYYDSFFSKIVTYLQFCEIIQNQSLENKNLIDLSLAQSIAIAQKVDNRFIIVDSALKFAIFGKNTENITQSNIETVNLFLQQFQLNFKSECYFAIIKILNLIQNVEILLQQCLILNEVNLISEIESAEIQYSSDPYWQLGTAHFLIFAQYILTKKDEWVKSNRLLREILLKVLINFQIKDEKGADRNEDIQQSTLQEIRIKSSNSRCCIIQ